MIFRRTCLWVAALKLTRFTKITAYGAAAGLTLLAVSRITGASPASTQTAEAASSTS